MALFHRFTLSLGGAEDLPAERDITISKQHILTAPRSSVHGLE